MKMRNVALTTSCNDFTVLKYFEINRSFPSYNFPLIKTFIIICDFTISKSQNRSRLTLVPFLCHSHVVCSSLAKIVIKATSPKPLLLFLLSPCLLSPFICPISTSRCLIESRRRVFRRDGRVFERTGVGFVCTLHFKRFLTAVFFHSETDYSETSTNKMS